MAEVHDEQSPWSLMTGSSGPLENLEATAATMPSARRATTQMMMNCISYYSNSIILNPASCMSCQKFGYDFVTTWGLFITNGCLRAMGANERAMRWSS